MVEYDISGGDGLLRMVIGMISIWDVRQCFRTCKIFYEVFCLAQWCMMLMFTLTNGL